MALVLPLATAAMELGRMQGTPVLGQPLQLMLPFTWTARDELTCIRAEFVQAEQAPFPMLVRAERLDDTRGAITLFSAVAVQDALVTVNVTYGCADAAITRGFVLLAEAPAIRAPTVSARPVPEAQEASPVPPAAAPAARPAKPASPAGPTAQAAPPASPQPAARPRPRRPETTPAPAAASRLRLDPLDVELDQAPVLRMATSLSAPGESALSRPQAAAAWRTLNLPPQEQLAALTREYQAELDKLRDLTRRAEELAPQGSRRDWLRDLFAALSASAAAVLGFLLWRRNRREPAAGWWNEDSRIGLHPISSQPAASVPRSAPPPSVSSSIDSVFSHPDPMQPSPPQPDSFAPTFKAGLGSNFIDSLIGRGRAPTAEELLDVHEKANFFLAVGQPDHAIELLESQAMEHLGNTPFLWLDLLDLCRRLDRRDEYERVRTCFQQIFSARMPPFESAQFDRGGLEAYPKALSRIQVLWPTRRVLQEIEKSLFEEPAPGSITFDLEASRDLLLLYSLAQDQLQEQLQQERDAAVALHRERELRDEQAAPEGGTATSPVPLVELDAGQDAQPARNGLDLDVDFNALDFERVRPQQLPQLRPDLDINLDFDLDLPATARTARDEELPRIA